MPVQHNPRRAAATSGERTYQTVMDWTRRVMQLAALATILLYGYILYGLLFGGFGQWSHVSNAADQARLAADAHGAVLYVNLALGLLLVTACILFYDEEALGYTLFAGAVVLYFGVPFLFDNVLTEQMAGAKAGHPVLIIREQFRVAAFMLAVPGVVLMVRDLVLRIADAGSRSHRDRGAIQYGATAREEAPASPAIIGMFAKCWQLPFCWEKVRKSCPIYHKRTRCWRERVGCMCEENVLRKIGDALINRQDSDLAPVGVTLDADSPDGASSEKTEELVPRSSGPPPKPKDVKIPHNPNLPMAFKVERCRNCIIYNEHQRLKYQFISPFIVLAIPGLAILEFATIYGWLQGAVNIADRTVARLSPMQGGQSADIAVALTSTPIVAQYLLIACLVVIATSMALRALEYVLFKLKI